MLSEKVHWPESAAHDVWENDMRRMESHVLRLITAIGVPVISAACSCGSSAGMTTAHLVVAQDGCKVTLLAMGDNHGSAPTVLMEVPKGDGAITLELAPGEYQAVFRCQGIPPTALLLPPLDAGRTYRIAPQHSPG